jgi:hypothetical protein
MVDGWRGDDWFHNASFGILLQRKNDNREASSKSLIL